MNSKTAIVIGIAAFVVIGGIVAAVLIANNGGNDDSKYVIYYGNGAEMKDCDGPEDFIKFEKEMSALCAKMTMEMPKEL